MRGLMRRGVVMAGAAVVLVGSAASLVASAPAALAAANPTLTTTPNPKSVTLGPTATTLKDSAKLSGGVHPTGSITFTLFQDGTQVDSELVTVTGNGTYTTPTGFTTPTPGTYQWDASYSGDGSNNPVSDTDNPNEQVVVKAASPRLATTPKPAKVTLGTLPPTLKDSAVISRGSNPTGTLTFTLFQGSTEVDSEIATVSGNGTYTTPTGFTTSTPGTYQWDAAYSGDGSNNPVSDTNNPGERAVVTKRSPGLTTTPSPAAVLLGKSPTTLKDSAVLSGGSNPSGTITFTLFQGGTLLDSEIATVTGNGTYTTPTGFLASKVGTYQWNAVYSGDSVNTAVSDTNNPGEQVVVAKNSAIWRVVLRHHVGPSANLTGTDAITATGKKDAWAFGASDLATFTGPIAYRWQGRQWRASKLPGGPGAVISAASEPSANDVWALGPNGYVLHFNGTRWRLVKRFRGNGSLTDIAAFSPTNVWAFGGPSSGPGLGTYHFNGRSWTKVTAATKLGIITVSALSARDMWATGTHSSLADSIFHYTGSWHRLTAAALRGLTFFHVMAMAKNNVWVEAARGTTSYLVHFNGRRWVRFKAPWSIFFGGMAPDGHGGIWLTAVDNARASWAVHRTAAGHWHRILISTSPDAGMENLAIIPGTSSLWAVGSLPHGPGTDATIWALGKIG